MASRSLICALLFLAVNAAYWRTLAAGAATIDVTIGYWLLAGVWAAKLEVYRRRARERRPTIRRLP